MVIVKHSAILWVNINAKNNHQINYNVKTGKMCKLLSNKVSHAVQTIRKSLYLFYFNVFPSAKKMCKAYYSKCQEKLAFFSSRKNAFHTHQIQCSPVFTNLQRSANKVFIPHKPNNLPELQDLLILKHLRCIQHYAIHLQYSSILMSSGGAATVFYCSTLILL